MWWRYFTEAKALNLSGSPNLFVVFQVSALVSILALAQLESFYPETFQGSADGVRLVFEALLVLCSSVYLSFHYALRKPATPAIYLGVAMTVVSLLLSIPSR